MSLVFIIIREFSGMPTGVVKWFDTAKGYGFLVPDLAGADLFLHVSEVRAAGIANDPKPGDKFSYDVGTRKDKRFATNLTRVPG